VVRDLVPKLWDPPPPGNGDGDKDEDGGGDGRNDGSESDEDGTEHHRRRNHRHGHPAPLPHGNIDLMIHIGMAGPRMFYCLERRGHRDGYLMPDVDGKILEDTRKPWHGPDWVWNGIPRELKSALDLDDVLERWKDNSPVSNAIAL
jgi:hypothetical protein